MMRVLIISLRYHGGGAERCARELFHLLPTVGIETEMWVSRRETSDPPGVHGMRFPWEDALNCLEAVPSWSDWRHRGSIRKLDAIRPGDFDVVHLHVIHSGCASIKAVHRLCERVPVVWTFHDEWAATGGSCYYLGDTITPQRVKQLTSGLWRYLPYHSYHDNFRFRRLRRFLKSWMPQPRAIISPSRYLLELTEHGGSFPSVAFHQIPYGVSLLQEPQATSGRNLARRSFGLNATDPVVLLIAASLADPRKGMLLAAEAINRLSVQRPIQTLLLGRSLDGLKHVLRGQQVVATYAPDNASLARAYRAADVTAIPSIADNYPYVALESLTCETPLVAFPIGGMPEIVGSNERGLLASEVAVDPLAESLQRLIEDDATRERMGRNGREWVSRVCGVEEYVSSVRAIYRQATGA